MLFPKSDNQLLAKELKETVFQHIQTDEEELADLSGMFARRQYPRKTMIVPAGDKWNKVFYIHHGIIRLFYIDIEGREFNKGFFREKHLVWPIAPVARNNEILFSIAALEDVSAYVCLFERFYTWLNQHGYWEKFALPYAESMAEDKFLREYEFLMNSATERFHNFCTEHPDLVKRIPDYHLASYLGITNVSLSRIKRSAKS